MLKSSLQLGTDQALVELSPVSARSRRGRSPRCGRCARCCCRDFSSTLFSSAVDVVRIAVTVVVEVVEHPPSAMLWLLLLRCCAHENSPFSVSVAKSAQLASRRRCCCCRARTPSARMPCCCRCWPSLPILVPDQTVNETGLDRCLRRSSDQERSGKNLSQSARGSLISGMKSNNERPGTWSRFA